MYDPVDILMSSGSSEIHTFDITSAFTPGTIGDVGVDTLTSAQLEIWTYDNDDNLPEKYKLKIDLDKLGGNYPAASGGSTVSATTANITVTSYLQPEGLLEVTLSNQNGAFYLDKEVLIYEFIEYIDSTPGGGATAAEPATMHLFGTGIAFAGSRLRRKKSV